MDTKIITSEKGKPLLLLNGFKFQKKKELKSGEMFWTRSNKSCNAKVFTLGHENFISRSNDDHNHEVNSKQLHRQIVSCASKREAEEDICEHPEK